MDPPAIDWQQGEWTTPPVRAERRNGDLLVTAAEGSDAWRHTSYGFVHDTEHALLAPFGHGTAMEVDFSAHFGEQFDQAGIFVRIDDENWIKAGVELADGIPQVGAVVTRGKSDWSVAPVPEWLGARVTVRVSWSGDALTVRARREGDAFRLVRVIPLEEELAATAGPFVCAPTRSELVVAFHAWRTGPADGALH
jgi:regulation of enolase protein 1 (concanavalin A-like superfamily)